jgi:hypothetical protein
MTRLSIFFHSTIGCTEFACPYSRLRELGFIPEKNNPIALIAA